MAGNVSSLVTAQEYQWLYGWLRCLGLLGPKREIDVVHVENAEAGFFDDVTVTPATGNARSPEFLQVKYHKRQDGWFSFEDHARMRDGKPGLLHKAWTTWKQLRTDHATADLVLVSPRQWSTDDPVIPDNSRWPDDFVDGDVTGKKLTARRVWSAALDDPDEAELSAFLASMRFRLGLDNISGLEEDCRDRMRLLGLRTDSDAMKLARTEIRERVMKRDAKITVKVMESIVEELELRDNEPEPAVTLQVHTIRRQDWTTGAVDMGNVYDIDWLDAFEGPEHERGRHLIDDRDWNERLLPELRAKATEIEEKETARLLLLRGFARLTAHFAVGYVFRRTAQWTIETRQGNDYWRTDVPAAVWEAAAAEQDLEGDEQVLALAIAVSGDPTPAAARYLTSAGHPAGRLTTISAPEPGPANVSTGSDLARLALDVKGYIQSIVPRPKRLLLFYWGPVTGAVFIGHQLNATAQEIQLFEEEGGVYKPSMMVT